MCVVTFPPNRAIITSVRVRCVLDASATMSSQTPWGTRRLTNFVLDVSTGTHALRHRLHTATSHASASPVPGRIPHSVTCSFRMM